MTIQVDDIALEEARKVVVLGSAGCGKSTLITRAVADIFVSEYQQTFGADLVVKTMTDSKRSTLHFWVCGGHSRYRPLLNQFYKDIHAAILTFDLTSVASFEELTFWYNEIKRSAPDAAMLLVGTKADAVDSIVIKAADAQAQAKEWGMEFKAVSAKTGTGVEDLFEYLASSLLH